MEKTKILIKVQKEAGAIPVNSVCTSCAIFIGLSDALALFPHCTMTQQEVRNLLDSHNPNNCRQENINFQNRCQGRRNLIRTYLDLCEENQKTIDN